jgi:hypothetical protein
VKTVNKDTQSAEIPRYAKFHEVSSSGGVLLNKEAPENTLVVNSFLALLCSRLVAYLCGSQLLRHTTIAKGHYNRPTNRSIPKCIAAQIKMIIVER